MDAATLKHLDAWLADQFNGDQYRAQVRETMLSYAQDDIEYWSAQSWWKLFDHANCERIERV